MTRVIVDEDLAAQAPRPSRSLWSCAIRREGWIGRFVSVFDPSEYEPWEPDFSDEELRLQEESDEESFTTAEVLAHLKKLELEGR